MPLGALAVSAAQMGLNAVGSGINASIQEHYNKKENQRNLDYYNMQRKDALSDYQRDVQYNDPVNQMSRLQNAGISPHLVQGSSALTSSPQTRGSSMSPAAKVNVGNNNAVNYMQAQQGVEQLKLLKLQQQKLLADTANVEADTDNKRLGYNSDNQSFNDDGQPLAFKRKQYELEQMLALVNKTREDSNNVAQRTATEQNNTRRTRIDADIAEIERLFRSDLLKGRSDLMNEQLRELLRKNKVGDIEAYYAPRNARNSADKLDYETQLRRQEAQLLDVMPAPVRYFLEKVGGVGFVGSIFRSLMTKKGK